MIFYAYHSETGEYLGERTGQLSPREDGVYLQPANTTDIVPLDGDGVNVFNGESWDLVEDHRGEVYYDGVAQVTISELGAIDEGLTADPVYPPKTWDDVRVERNALLAACDWTQLPDAPLSENQKNDYGVYRQALRDITENFDNPDDVEYPEV